MLTAEQLLKIEQDAQKATPGPYVADNDNICVPDEDHDFGFRTIAEVWTCGYRDVPPMTALDAIYFANLDPQTIMELVKMARRSAALTELAACMYQAAGAFNMPVRFLDALSAAAQGEPFEHMLDSLLPVTTDEPGAWDPDSAINSQRKEGGEG